MFSTREKDWQFRHVSLLSRVVGAPREAVVESLVPKLCWKSDSICDLPEEALHLRLPVHSLAKCIPFCGTWSDLERALPPTSPN